MKPTFLISAPVDTFSGYGARSRDLIKSIVELDKYNVKVLPQRWGNTPWGFISENPRWKFLEELFIQRIEQQPDIWMQITVPNEFQPIGKYNIGVTAGMETTGVHHSWVEGINRMDLNIVPSEHSKTTFLNSNFQQQNQQGQIVGELKVAKPIEVLFEGVDLDIFKEIPAPELTFDFNFDQIPEKFCYLFVGHWLQGGFGEDRKNVGLLVKSFLETFKNKKDQPALIMKTAIAGASIMSREEVLGKIDSIRKTVKGNLPNIYLLHGDFTDEQMNELYNQPKVKAMVSLTKGEGFGRPLLEWTTSRKPIITTNWSGHVDFINPEFCNLINGELKPVHQSAVVKDMILPETQWFNANHGEVGFYLRDVYINYKKYVDGGKRQAYKTRTEFSREKMRDTLSSLLEKNLPEFAVQVPLQLPKLQLPKLELPELK